MTWAPFANPDASIRGSEGGVIIRDDEHDLGARITLERDAATSPFAITCGVYGWMVHTAFFANEQEALQAYEAMRDDLIALMANIPDDPMTDEQISAMGAGCSAFCDRY